MNKIAQISLLLLLALHAILFFICAAGQSFSGKDGRYVLLADDAMISMRYAENLVHNGELVWQRGRRVMGITNPGWTLLMAATMPLKLPRRTASLPILIINGIINLLIIYLVFTKILRIVGLPYALLASGWLAICTPLLFWSVHGFETPLETLLITAAMFTLIPIKNADRKNSPAIALLLLVAAYFVRPDAALLFIVYATLIFAFPIFDKYTRKSAAIATICGITFIAATIIAQKLYYGDWLPNTFYLKSSGGAKSIAGGISYIIQTKWRNGILPISLLAVLGFVRWFLKSNRKKASALLSIFIIWGGYIIWTGGDAFPHGRFLLPLLPMLLVVAAMGTKFTFETLIPYPLEFDMRNSLRNWIYAVVFSIIVVATYFWGAVSLDEFIIPDPNRVDRVAVAEGLERMKLPPSTTIALFEAGTIPFLLPQYRYIDLLGKNDKYIARTEAHAGLVGHNKWDFDYSIGKMKPDIISTRDNYEGIDDAIANYVLKNMDDFSRDKVFFPLALWVHPIFKKYYRHNRIYIETPKKTHWIFRKNS